MGTLRFVTLTGAGELTSFDEMNRISQAHPYVEWAVMYCPQRAGTVPLYPSFAWLHEFIEQAEKAELNVALHLHGRATADLLEVANSAAPYAPSPGLRLLKLVERFGRVQLNMHIDGKNEALVEQTIKVVCRGEARTCVVLLWNQRNAASCARLRREHGCEVLFSALSGGPIEPPEWHVPDMADFMRIGYEGGLGPDNVAEQLPRIHAAANQRAFSIGMRDMLRTRDDQFDLAKCAAVLTLCDEFILQQMVRDGAVHGEGEKRVQDLHGYWLDWWVGAARSANLVIPPEGAVAAQTLYRPSGRYERYSPCENRHQAIRILQDERIALTPSESGMWTAKGLDGEFAMSDEELVVAGMRAVVAKHFGLTVPLNPARVYVD